MTPWTAACQASLSITNSQSLLRLMSIELVMPSNHLILCRPLLLLPPIFPSIRVFSNESALRIGWPKYWSFSFSISPSNGYPALPVVYNFPVFYLLLGNLSVYLPVCLCIYLLPQHHPWYTAPLLYRYTAIRYTAPWYTAPPPFSLLPLLGSFSLFSTP